MVRKTDEQYREEARIDYKCENIVVDTDALVDRTEEGAWVQVWVWIAEEEE